MFCRGRISVSEHRNNFATKTLGIELESCFTAAGKLELGIIFDHLLLEWFVELDYGLSVKTA